ncbi:MAG: hypothetical protein BWY35_02281 [Firmicutes bacterium ADurb.Bin248]|nr:MAG: hypothetical protein BWY35_02281 [Firmicutes bacterium ADurb.Bin248]
MKSVKPGRGPSAMSAWGSVVAALFGVFWIVAALQMGAPWIFPAFGVLFIISAAAGAVYHYKNATGKNRFGSEADDNADPGDYGGAPPSGGYCPYCGAPAGEDYEYCRRCGKKL